MTLKEKAQFKIDRELEEWKIESIAEGLKKLDYYNVLKKEVEKNMKNIGDLKKMPRNGDRSY